MSDLGSAACGCNSVACDFALSFLTLGYRWKIIAAKFELQKHDLQRSALLPKGWAVSFVSQRIWP